MINPRSIRHLDRGDDFSNIHSKNGGKLLEGRQTWVARSFLKACNVRLLHIHLVSQLGLRQSGSQP